MSSYHLICQPDRSGWRFALTHKRVLPFPKKEAVALTHWSGAAQAHAGVALLLALLDTEEAQSDQESIRISHERLAGLTRAEAMRLGLPAISPFTLYLSHDAPISDASFNVRVEWTHRNGLSVIGTRRQGTALAAEGRDYLILNPLYATLEAIDALNAASGDVSPAGFDRRMADYAQLKAQLTLLTGDVHADEYLRGLTIHHATGLGIDLEPGSDQDPFLPTLYGNRPNDAAITEPGDDTSLPGASEETSREPLLPQHHAQLFERRFLSQGARSHYVVGMGIYTVLDAPVAAALEVLERVNHADTETRQRFREDPMSFLTPAIEEAGGDGDILCDLRRYGDRVTGIGRWVPPSLSFPLAVSRDWFPEEEMEVFIIQIPGEPPLMVKMEDIAPLKDRVTQGQAVGAKTCEFAGRTLALSQDFVETIHGLASQITPGAGAAPKDGEAKESFKVAALTQNNEEMLTFLAEQRLQRLNVAPGLPQALLTPPMPHQIEGLAWLQAAYRAGAPGLLLADDMGLGKTYQVLVFLKWLRAQNGGTHGGLGGPILIVAPKTLLGNWCEEIQIHLGHGALGPELHAYERGLKAIKLHSGGGNDTTLHRQTLDVAAIEAIDLVLTTYETLRDYHLSFGKVRFEVIVYDEAQKLKNPTSLMNRGAKAQQGGFTLLMTGTPIENTVLDLWTLLDIAWPGFLGLSAREFINRYRGDKPERREELKKRLIEPNTLADQDSPVPAIMLRRFKQEILVGLPERRVEATQDAMPPVQQAAYDAVLTTIRQNPKSALEGLQQLRSISLHPHLGQSPECPEDDGPYIAASARFTRLFVILDQIHARREKALIFVELREAQGALYDLIRRRYKLTAPLPETINGATAAQVRDRIRREFQQRSGFDVLILGPKAAGFGLTLTAANHVIHLNRWWNPAVEDQCSDRVYRIGATKPVTIYLPQAIHPQLGERSFDSLLHGLLEEKRRLSTEIVVPVQFNDQDFHALFEKSLGEGVLNTETLAHVDGMDWRSFELWVADEVNRAGYNVEVTKGRRDGGADVIGNPKQGGRPIFIQCKHSGKGSTGQVDEGAVNDLLRARETRKQSHPSPFLAAVTNARFSFAAENLAREYGVQLFDWTKLQTFRISLAKLSQV